ncbi:MAG: FAD:protein FMN transferase [Chthoniobacteraceae bacterium]
MRQRSSEARRARPLLGTFVEIVVPEPDRDPAAAIDAAFAAIEEVRRRMSFHDRASTLSRLNREAARRAVRVDAWTFEVLRAAREMHLLSGGVFDVTIARRLQSLGFLPGDVAPKSGGSFGDVELTTGGRVRFHHPGIQIDLGGIAKGFAVDQAVDALREVGISSALVNAGGDLRAFGEAAFPISIRHPNDPSATLTTFAIRDSAVATSAHYFADRLAPGTTASPIVHPRLRRQPTLPRSVTVRAPNAMHADALTKIVMLAVVDALPVLAHFSADALFVSTTGQAECSEGWDATLHHSS